MRVLVLTLLTFKKVKLIFGHPVFTCRPKTWHRWKNCQNWFYTIRFSDRETNLHSVLGARLY